VRNGEIHIGVSRWIIDPRVERAVWLKELRVKFNLALNVNRANRRSKLHNLVHKLLLCSRGGEGHAHLRAEPGDEKIAVVLDSNFLGRVSGKCCSFPGRIVFVGIKPPPRTTKQRQDNDEQNHHLPG
jgi:hypothetical protein